MRRSAAATLQLDLYVYDACAAEVAGGKYKAMVHGQLTGLDDSRMTANRDDIGLPRNFLLALCHGTLEAVWKLVTKRIQQIAKRCKKNCVLVVPGPRPGPGRTTKTAFFGMVMPFFWPGWDHFLTTWSMQKPIFYQFW